MRPISFYRAVALALGLLALGRAGTELSAQETALPQGGLSLEAALERGRQLSFTVALKRLELDKARAALDEADSRRKPKAGLTASGSYLANPPEGLIIRQGSLGSAPAPTSQFPIPFPEQDYVLMEDTRNSYFKLSLDASLPIFTWGKLERGVEIARAAQESANASLRAAERGAEKEVKRAYLSILTASASLSLLTQMEGLLAQRLKAEEGAYAEGIITLQDLLSVRSDLAKARSQRLRAQEGLSTALAALAYLLDIPGLALEDLASGMDVFISQPGLDSLADSILEERALAPSPESAELRTKLKMAEGLVALQSGSGPFRPDIQLMGSLSVAGQHIPLVQGNWTDTWDANLVLSLAGQMSLYDGGEAQAKLAQARAQAEMARRGLAELGRSRPISLRRLLQSTRSARAALEEKEAALALATEQEKNARVSRENELLTEKDERAAISARLAAQLECELARMELALSLLELEELCQPHP